MSARSRPSGLRARWLRLLRPPLLPQKSVQLASRKVAVEGLTGTFTPERLPRALPSPLEQWVAAVDRGEPMQITIRDGRNLTQLLEGIYTSAREGREHRFQ